MSEIPTPPQEQKITKFRLFSMPESTLPKELRPVMEWAHEQMKALPEMKVTRSTLIDTNPTNKWEEVRNENNELTGISSKFFSFEGFSISTPTHAWKQGGVVQRSEMLPTENNESMPVSGMVYFLKDEKGNVFLTMQQEPFATAAYKDKDRNITGKQTENSTEIHPVVRTPLQTSVEKMQKILTNPEENAKYDPTLSKVLTTLSQTRKQSPKDIMVGVSLTKLPTDGNRLVTDVVYGTIAVSTNEAKQISQDIPNGRWCSQEEVELLLAQGLTNGHLAEGLSVSHAQEKVTKLTKKRSFFSKFQNRQR